MYYVLVILLILLRYINDSQQILKDTVNKITNINKTNVKKLLSLLSTITIAGSGITGIVARSRPMPANSEINYQQTNNLENLNRVQRNMCNNSYIEKFTNIESDIRNIAVDSKENIYFYKSENNTPNMGRV